MSLTYFPLPLTDIPNCSYKINSFVSHLQIFLVPPIIWTAHLGKCCSEVYVISRVEWILSVTGLGFWFLWTIVQIKSSQTFFLHWLTRWMMFPCVTHSCEKTRLSVAISCHIFAIPTVKRVNQNAGKRLALGRCLWICSALSSKKQRIHELLFLNHYFTHFNSQLIKSTPLCVVTHSWNLLE